MNIGIVDDVTYSVPNLKSKYPNSPIDPEYIESLDPVLVYNKLRDKLDPL